jgi:hypothetical protein
MRTNKNIEKFSRRIDSEIKTRTYLWTSRVTRTCSWGFTIILHKYVLLSSMVTFFISNWVCDSNITLGSLASLINFWESNWLPLYHIITVSEIQNLKISSIKWRSRKNYVLFLVELNFLIFRSFNFWSKKKSWPKSNCITRQKRKYITNF